MRRFILAVVILMAFIAAGGALECLDCTNRNGSTCNENPKTCLLNETTCEHSFVEIEIDGQATNIQVFKGCSTKECKNLTYSESFKGLNDRIIRVCCKGDLCNNGTITLPPRNNTLNGRKCPSCYGTDAAHCSNTALIACRGNETGCITFEGLVDIEGGKPFMMVANGCTNLEHCDPAPLFPGGLVPENHTMICTKAPIY